MIENYYDKSGRHQWRTYCDTCHALVGDTAPLKEHLSRQDSISNTCPKCGGKIVDSEAPEWSPPIH
jgi:RNase P subunit RPR2